MDIYRYVPDPDNFESISVRPEHRTVRNDFVKCKPLKTSWRPVPVETSRAGPFVRSDFPSFYGCIPVFSSEAWDVLRPLIEDVVEALPLLHPERDFIAINVLEVIDALDRSKCDIMYNRVTNRVSRIRTYRFRTDMLRAKHCFRIPETSGREVFVSDQFTRLVDEHGLKGLRFKQLG